MERLRHHEQVVTPELPLHVPIIGLIGSTKAGKDHAVKYLHERFGTAHVTTSDIIRDYAISKDITLTNKPDYWRTRYLMEAELGVQFMINETFQMAREAYSSSNVKPNGIVVNGIRTVQVVEGIINRGNYFLVAIHARPETRFNRTREHRSDDTTDYEQFKRDNFPEDQAIDLILPYADAHIHNEGSVQEYEEQLTHEMLVRFAR